MPADANTQRRILQIVQPQTAIGFPGQGAGWEQTVETIVRHSDDGLVRRLVELTGISDFSATSPTDTHIAQPAMYTASVLNSRSLRSAGIAAAIGHSFGELAALTFAQVVSETDGLRLAFRRGELGSEVHLRTPGVMVAAIGVDHSTIERCREASISTPLARLDVAVINHAQQVVLTGDQLSVSRFVVHMSTTAGRTRVLPIGGPFHTELMADAAGEFLTFASAIEMNPPRLPVVFSSGGGSLLSGQDPSDVPRRLARSLVKPVDWPDAIQRLRQLGIEDAIDGGPGDTLTRIGKRAGLRFAPYAAVPSRQRSDH